MKDRRKGFTLVGLLITIVVIGILSAMIVFASSEAVTSAKAAEVIAEMTLIKKAVISWRFDNFNRVVANGIGTKDEVEYTQYFILDDKGEKKAFKEFVEANNKEILKYLSNTQSVKLTNKDDSNLKEGDYVLIDYIRHFWYVCYDTGSNVRLQKKLAGRAKSAGLFGLKSDIIKNDVVTNKNYTGGRYVCMLILALPD